MAFERPPYVPDWAEPERAGPRRKREHQAHPDTPKDSADVATEMIRESGLGPRRLGVMVFLSTLRRGRNIRRAYQAGRFAVDLARRPTVAERKDQS